MDIDVDVAAVEEEEVSPPPITKDDLLDVFDALGPTARYIYIGKNAHRYESRPERALVHVGAVATYFNQFGGLSNEDTRAVHAAVETNLRVIETQFPPDSDGGFEYLKKREALYDQALEMTKTPDSSPSPVRPSSAGSLSTPRVKRASESVTPSSSRRKMEMGVEVEVATGMMANNRNQAAANDRVQGRARQRFVPLDQVMTMPGAGPQIQAAIKAKFDEFVADTLSEYGPSTAITIAHAAAIVALSTTGTAAAWGAVAGVLHASDYARRHYRKKRKARERNESNAQRNAQLPPEERDDPILEQIAEGWHGGRRIGAVAVGTGVGTTWLAQADREASWITYFFGEGVYRGIATAAGSGTRIPATERQLAQRWASLPGNRVLTFLPEIVYSYPNFFATVGTGVGIAMIASNYNDVEKSYERERLHGWLAKNGTRNAELWESEMETYLSSIQYNTKAESKRQIRARLTRVVGWRKTPPDGVSMVEHIHDFIDRMENVQDRIVALLKYPPAEYDEVVNPDPYALGAPPAAAMAAAMAAAAAAAPPPMAAAPPGGAAGAPVVEEVFAKLHRMKFW